MKKGFTLVELLAIIGILGIILMIVIPKISNVIEGSKKKFISYSSKINCQSRRKLLD